MERSHEEERVQMKHKQTPSLLLPSSYTFLSLSISSPLLSPPLLFSHTISSLALYLFTLTLGNSSPCAEQSLEQPSTVQAVLIYPSAAQSNLNKHISPN